MTAVGYGLDDKVSLSGDTMSGTLAFEGVPPFTVVRGQYAGTVTLNGTTPVSVSAAGAINNALIFLSVQAGTPAGVPYVASIQLGSGFTVASTSGSDTAVTVAWVIIAAV